MPIKLKEYSKEYNLRAAMLNQQEDNAAIVDLCTQLLHFFGISFGTTSYISYKADLHHLKVQCDGMEC